MTASAFECVMIYGSFNSLKAMRSIGAFVFAVLLALPAWAVWPVGPVKIVVPYAPGGPGDSLGRLAAEVLSKRYGQVFFVENRPGAAGALAALAVSKVAADGQTLLIGASGSLAIGPAFADPGYHPVNASLPVTDLRSFLARAAASKTGTNWAAGGRGTVQQLIGEMLMSSAAIGNAVHVDYKGDGPLLNDLLGGHIEAAFMTLSAARAHIKAGSLRALALSTSRRNPEFKELPTFLELGYPELTSATWFCLSAPDGLPTELVAQLNREVRMGLRQPAVQRQLLAQDFEAYDLGPLESTRFIESETLRWGALVRALDGKAKPAK
jgi:tripartite-type tricarboxylate transporter receptor subunit TctC